MGDIRLPPNLAARCRQKNYFLQCRVVLCLVFCRKLQQIVRQDVHDQGPYGESSVLCLVGVFCRPISHRTSFDVCVPECSLCRCQARLMYARWRTVVQLRLTGAHVMSFSTTFCRCSVDAPLVLL